MSTSTPSLLPNASRSRATPSVRNEGAGYCGSISPGVASPKEGQKLAVSIWLCSDYPVTEKAEKGTWFQANFEEYARDLGLADFNPANTGILKIISNYIADCKDKGDLCKFSLDHVDSHKSSFFTFASTAGIVKSNQVLVAKKYKKRIEAEAAAYRDSVALRKRLDELHGVVPVQPSFLRDSPRSFAMISFFFVKSLLISCIYTR